MAAKGSHGLLLLAGDDLPQIAQNSQKLLLGIASHRFHRSTQKLLILGGALVSARLCRLPEQEVHQPSKQWLSHRLHRFAQIVWVRKILPQIAQMQFQGVHLSQVHQPNKQWSSHRFHRFTQMVRLRKIVAEVSLPPQQQSASHRLHRSTQKLGCLQGAKLASSTP